MLDPALALYLPSSSIHMVEELLQHHPIEVRIVKKRKTKHGDFRRLPNGRVQITLNEHPNGYRFLITFLHEMAHHIAFQKHGYSIRPHGEQWQAAYREVVASFLEAAVFPSPLDAVYAQHVQRPKASSDTDIHLAQALRAYDPPTNKIPLMNVEEGECFALDNGRRFEKGPQRRKRFTCRELSTGKLYLIQPLVEVVSL